MLLNSEDPIRNLTETVSLIRRKAGHNERITFVSGNFNVVHPGHLRLLKFARECGDFLVVAVTDDSNPGVIIPRQLRLEGIKAISYVNYACPLSVPPSEFIALLKPDIVIKGKEHEGLFNPEQPIVESYGGKLLFGSGETSFSSMDLLKQEFQRTSGSNFEKPSGYLQRHSIDMDSLVKCVNRFLSLRVIVIGDLIIDEYITCDPLGMSQEDPTIVVTPIKRDNFIGGAGIVAAHARGLGARAQLFSVIGDDVTGNFAKESISRYGVEASLISDDSRPTTLKQRFRAHGKTLLRVSHLRQHEISRSMAASLLDKLKPAIEYADLMIFCDFNYGCLPQPMVEEIIAYGNHRGIMMVADSQSSSQVGDVTRFRGMRLITPTEHEARLSMHDDASGLAVLANSLQMKSEASHVIITLGREGLLVHTQDCTNKNLTADQLPALNSEAKDPSGAGDSLLTCASMSLAVGANIWESAYLGSIAAACQVGRVGNLPLSADEIIQEILM